MTDTSSAVSGVAQRYASALFDLAKETDNLDGTEKALGNFSALLTESDDLMRLVRSPVYSAEDQDKALNAVMAKAGISGMVSNFVRLATSNRRAFAIPDMIRGFSALLADHRGEANADVVSAEALSEAQISALKAVLKDAAGKDVSINQSTDASLIGGMIVKIGSRMIDTSLKTKLQSLKIAMKEVR